MPKNILFFLVYIEFDALFLFFKINIPVYLLNIVENLFTI